MANKATMPAQAQEQVVQSAVAAVVVEMIGGRPAVELQETIFTIGEQTFDAESMMLLGESRREVLDANLHDIVKGIPYLEFMLVRDFFKSGITDKGKSDDAAQKVWERSVNRMVSTFEFVKPKSEAKDAVRKAEAKAKQIAAFEAQSDDQLEDSRAELLGKGDQASLRKALTIGKELERRNADSIKADADQRKLIVSKIVTRVKELSKANTDDADALLVSVLMMIEA
jgi:hypothetical protein